MPNARKSTSNKSNIKGATNALAQPTIMNPKEQALADLVGSFAAMVSGCFDLHRDGRLAPADQNQWWLLGTAGMRVVVRFDGAWTRIIAKTSPSTAELKHLDARADTAVVAIRHAKQAPSTNRLNAAAAEAATAIDVVDSMVDVATI